MSEIPLSLAEKTFILHGVDANFRNDGRSRYQYRSLELETKLMPQTNGSARVRIGNTDILVGIKVDIDTPFPDRPHEGKLEFFVDCSANAAPDFEGKGGDNLATEISNTLSLAYQSPGAFDLRTLSILSHKKCWKMYIDILILQCGGNLFDAAAAAVKAALKSTEIPRITTALLDGGDTDIQLSDDPYDCIKLDVSNFPVTVTLCKIGDNCIVDPTLEEEMCSAVKVVVSVMPSGRVTSVTKIGYGSVQPATLVKMLEIGEKVAINLNAGLMKALEEEDKLGIRREICGFLK